MQYVPFLLHSATLSRGQGLKGNSSRFANHSCAPNCRMIRYRLADYDEWQIGLFSSTDIKRGSELTCAFTSSHVEATAHKRQMTMAGSPLPLWQKRTASKCRPSPFRSLATAAPKLVAERWAAKRRLWTLRTRARQRRSRRRSLLGCQCRLRCCAPSTKESLDLRYQPSTVHIDCADTRVNLDWRRPTTGSP
jgi:histone-lysine N-methyltransferase ASH1L